MLKLTSSLFFEVTQIASIITAFLRNSLSMGKQHTKQTAYYWAFNILHKIAVISDEHHVLACPKHFHNPHHYGPKILLLIQLFWPR